MSKPGYLSINVTPARRLNIDDARFVMRQPKATDIEVLDFALHWLLVTAERVKLDATKRKKIAKKVGR